MNLLQFSNSAVCVVCTMSADVPVQGGSTLGLILWCFLLALYQVFSPLRVSPFCKNEQQAHLVRHQATVFNNCK